MTSRPATDLQDLPPELPKSIAILAWGGGVLVTLLVPAIFLLVGYLSEVARIENALQIGVQHINSQSHISSGKRSGGHSPQEILASLDWLQNETNISVTVQGHVLLSKQNGDLDPPMLTRSAVLDLGESGIGMLELQHSMFSLLVYGLLMLVPGVMLGTIAFITLRDLPMRVFRRALQEIAIRKEAEEQLAKSLSIFSATLESTADGIFVTDALGREVVINQHFRDMWGLRRPAHSYAPSNETLIELTQQLREPEVFLSTMKNPTLHVDVTHGTTLELRDGRHFEWNSQPQFVNGVVVGRVTSFRDVSDRKRAEALLSTEKEVLEMVVCGQPLTVALGFLAEHVEKLSGEMFCAILFKEEEESANLVCASGRGLPSNVVNDITHHGQEALNQVFADIIRADIPRAHGLTDEFSGVIENISEHPIWADYCNLVSRYAIEPCFAVAVRSSAGQLLGLIVAHYRNSAKQQRHDRELTWVAAHLVNIAIERHQSENQLQLMAHYDALTKLPNRALFHDRLHQALARAERSRSLVALMFLDLDRFKTINDTLGHDVGDLLLREVSARLLMCVREVDTVARLGGDEFTVILEAVNKAEDAATIASKIIEALASPILLDNQEMFVPPSIGITIYPTDSVSAETLLKNADTAMYRAKGEGGNGYRFFTAEMNTLAIDRLELESGLRHALERDEFLVYYQPKLKLSTGMIHGAEALVRWKHPSRGIVSPALFIPILEEIGLIEQVGAWVLKTVCAQIRDWQDAGVLPPLIVAVNLSGRQLQRNTLPLTIAQILEDTGVDPEFLELEVTESMLMHDPKCAVDLLQQIRNKGILHIDVDDFGTGYSSLSYLKQFPIDCLKLDKSFVDGLPHDADDIAISQAVIALAHSLGLSVIAEGVEKEEQLDFLRHNGCDIIQGYLVSRPVPVSAFEQLVLQSMSGGVLADTKQAAGDQRSDSRVAWPPFSEQAIQLAPPNE